MKVAICIWGLCRSTEYTFESFKTNVLDILRQGNIDISVFLHTWKLTRKYTNSRAGENGIFLKTTTWKYYNPRQYCIENQDEVDKTLKLQSYRRHGDPWLEDAPHNYIPFSCVDNVIRALYSLKKVTDMWVSLKEQFDCILYIRPDVRFLKPLNLDWLMQISEGTIYMPDFHLIEGVNDRFAFGKPAVMKVYGERYIHALEYSITNALHSERFLAYYLRKYGISVHLIPFRFRRIRAGNIPYMGDSDL